MAPTPADCGNFGFVTFSKNMDVGISRWDLGSAGCLQWSATSLTANGKYKKTNTKYAGNESKILSFAPDYWVLHPTTWLFTRLLGFAPDDWAFHPTTGLCTPLLGFSSDYWAFHPTTGLFTRILGFASDYCTLGGSWDLPGTASDQPNQHENDRNLEHR